METVLLVVQVLICVALIIAVLIQRSESDGFGLGSGSGSNFLSGRGAANLLTRTTAVLATLFMVNSLLLSVLVSQRSDSPLSDVLGVESQAPSVVEGTAKDGAPVVPEVGNTNENAVKDIKNTQEKPAVPEVE